MTIQYNIEIEGKNDPSKLPSEIDVLIALHQILQSIFHPSPPPIPYYPSIEKHLSI